MNRVLIKNKSYGPFCINIRCMKDKQSEDNPFCKNCDWVRDYNNHKKMTITETYIEIERDNTVKLRDEK